MNKIDAIVYIQYYMNNPKPGIINGREYAERYIVNHPGEFYNIPEYLIPLIQSGAHVPEFRMNNISPLDSSIPQNTGVPRNLDPLRGRTVVQAPGQSFFNSIDNGVNSIGVTLGFVKPEVATAHPEGVSAQDQILFDRTGVTPAWVTAGWDPETIRRNNPTIAVEIPGGYLQPLQPPKSPFENFFAGFGDGLGNVATIALVVGGLLLFTTVKDAIR